LAPSAERATADRQLVVNAELWMGVRDGICQVMNRSRTVVESSALTAIL